MSKIKLSFAFLLTLMLVAMFSIVVSAAGASPGTAPGDHGGVYNGQVSDDTSNDNNYNTVDKSNANKTGSGVGGQTENFSNVIKSDDMVKGTDGSHGPQRTHGSYMNNTNSCASCHQTHTAAGASLLFKDGEYATCTACHDGTLGFYNVMGTGSNSAGTFGGSHDGNMSAHLANGTVKLSAAPGGNNLEVTGRGGEWTEEFTCANCHAPHGSYSDRLLNEDPNGMGNTLIKDGGKKLEGTPVLDKTTLPDMKVKYAAADIEITDALGVKSTVNYVVYRFNIGDTGAPTNADYAAKGLQTGDVVLQLMKWNGTQYVIDTDPWLHEYDFDSSHTKHYWTAFYDGSKYADTYVDPAYRGKYIDKVHTDSLKAGEKLGQGFLGVRADNTTNPGATALTTTVNGVTFGNIARSYVVKLDVSTPDANNVTTTNVATLWGSSAGGKGVAMSTWCASCHTDYLASSGKETGTFDHAYRHTTTSDSYTCVRCHFAHGTDVTIMRDARGLTYQNILADTTNYFPGVTGDARTAMVKDYLLDKNPSSALKRYTNMAVCWGCHTSSHSGGTRNTDSYQYNTTPGVNTDRNGIDNTQTPNTPNAGY
ncbi:cytochrome c3 family protein [Neobacillus cucumis]|uniref:cytochrome c3 family protein n=1 Tax=Neobacillus cucumis TaxID=1740721 RepID=UPI002E1CC43C|nr:cytochrome c3 family protein [Neobacillus cucumis]